MLYAGQNDASRICSELWTCLLAVSFEHERKGKTCLVSNEIYFTLFFVSHADDSRLKDLTLKAARH